MTDQLPVSHPRAAPAIRVGVTEKHGMALEFSQHPPEGVEYSFLSPLGPAPWFVSSPIKGYLRRFEADGHDLVESLLSPIQTNSPWIYSCENLPAATAFTFRGAPLPRVLRIAYISRLLRRDNCRAVVLWSDAGRKTFESYGRIRDRRLLDKVTTVYPAIGRIADDDVRYSDRGASLLFTGDFFRKGGANVIDAFERLRPDFPDMTLTLCCDERIHFQTPNTRLRDEYLARIRQNPHIRSLGLIPRDRLVREILPDTDVYLLPTYVETFGFAILEAMAFGIPVISTNYFAIPEMIEHGRTGFLIDTTRFDCDRLFRGYVVDQIPDDFRTHVTDSLYGYLRELVASAELRRRIGTAALEVARTKFSVERRNREMLAVYRRALTAAG